MPTYYTPGNEPWQEHGTPSVGCGLEMSTPFSTAGDRRMITQADPMVHGANERIYGQKSVKRTRPTSARRRLGVTNAQLYGLAGPAGVPNLARVERSRPMVDTRTTMEMLKKQSPEVWKHKSLKFAEGGRLAEEAEGRRRQRGAQIVQPEREYTRYSTGPGSLEKIIPADEWNYAGHVVTHDDSIRSATVKTAKRVRKMLPVLGGTSRLDQVKKNDTEKTVVRGHRERFDIGNPVIDYKTGKKITAKHRGVRKLDGA